MRRSISKITPVPVKRGKSYEPTCVFITSAVFTRRLAIVHQQRFTLLSQERSVHLRNCDFDVLTIWVTLKRIDEDCYMHHQDTHIFLAEPAPIEELDGWILTYQKSQRRFTFTEAEVLQTYWHQGEDILLREDSRFKEAALPDMAFPGQWQLSHHKIANQLIYESLV